MKNNNHLRKFYKILDDKKFKLTKQELEKNSTINVKLNTLVVTYTNHIINQNSLINEIVDDKVTPYSKDEKYEFIYSYNCELQTYEYCLYQCINTITSKKTFEDCLLKVQRKIDNCQSELYSSFITSKEAYSEVSSTYSILKKFNIEIINLIKYIPKT